MRKVTPATTSATTSVSARPHSSPSQGDAPNAVVTYAVAYAPRPTNAAWPNDVRPATPVSSTRPSTTIA